MKRVVITGAGTVNALAMDVAGTLAALAAGRSGIGPLELPDIARLSIRIGAPVRGWSPETRPELVELAGLDRFAQFAVVAARQAVAQSGIETGAAASPLAGVVLGSAGGGLSTFDASFRAVYQEGRNRVHPLTVPRVMHNAAASHLSMAFGLRGPCLTISTACASANQAMGLAFQMVRAGAAPVMLTGGADAMLTFGGLKAWEGLRVMSPDACRPFSLDRNGMVEGEGAAVFVLEERSRARARGAPILAEVVGFAATADAADLLHPSGAGAVRAMELALQDAGVPAASVGYLNAHGTGTAVNDRVEAQAIRQVFGKAVAGLAVSSTKAMHGHVMGATGAVELLACLMALGDGVIAPTVGHRQTDPDCGLDVVPNVARRNVPVAVAMSNALAFGGSNAVLVLRRDE